MLERAQSIIKQVQNRMRTTRQIVADLAEAAGVPTRLTTWLQPEVSPNWPDPTRPPAVVGDDVDVALWQAKEVVRDSSPPVPSPPAPSPEPTPLSPSGRPGDAGDAPVRKAAGRSGNGVSRAKKGTRGAAAKKRSAPANQQLPAGVRPLAVDAEIGKSTYLARIVWALGVSRLEGSGALRPADIARMVMSRSAISLEPPNVARYIRRSKPTCVLIDRTEGGSSFYKLNAEGKRLFEQYFLSDGP